MPFAPYIQQFASYLAQERERQKKLEYAQMGDQMLQQAQKEIASAKTQQEADTVTSKYIPYFNRLGDENGIKNIMQLNTMKQSSIAEDRKAQSYAAQNISFNPAELVNYNGQLVTRGAINQTLDQMGLSPEAKYMANKNLQPAKSDVALGQQTDKGWTGFRYYKDENGNIIKSDQLDENATANDPKLSSEIWDRQYKTNAQNNTIANTNHDNKLADANYALGVKKFQHELSQDAQKSTGNSKTLSTSFVYNNQSVWKSPDIGFWIPGPNNTRVPVQEGQLTKIEAPGVAEKRAQGIHAGENKANYYNANGIITGIISTDKNNDLSSGWSSVTARNNNADPYAYLQSNKDQVIKLQQKWSNDPNKKDIATKLFNFGKSQGWYGSDSKKRL